MPITIGYGGTLYRAVEQPGGYRIRPIRGHRYGTGDGASYGA